MKTTSCVTHVMVLALGAALGCEPGPRVPPPPGGQSGDDGTERDPEPIPPPHLPEPPCEPKPTPLGASDVTVLGASVQGLIDDLELAEEPLFWVPFDEIAATTFAPGPGETTLKLAIELRPGENARQVVQKPKNSAATCPVDVVSVPVQVRLATADGALDESFDAMLDFTTRRVVRLSAQLLVDELTGSFVFGAIGAPTENIRAQALIAEMEFWPGGSRGSIRPSFERTEAAATSTPRTNSPEPASPPSPTAPRSDGLDQLLPPSVPEHWSAVAVWPRRETCPEDGRSGVAVEADDPLLGVSPNDIVTALRDDTGRVLASPLGQTPVHVSYEEPSGLVCVSPLGGPLEFDVRARLRAEGATPGSLLDHLDATTVLRVGGHKEAGGDGLVELHWARRDVRTSQARGAFEAATGLTLEAPDDYRDIWWSWQGFQKRARATEAWSVRAAFSVSSLNPEQAAELASATARGGPGPSLRMDADGFPVLPGDTLIDAALPRQ